MKKKAIYIGNFEFPTGNAAGKRVYANGKVLEELGYNVYFVGQKKSNLDEVRLSKTKDYFEEFTYYNYTYPQNNIEWMKYNKAFEEFKVLLLEEKLEENLELIIYYGSPRFSHFNKLLIDYCKLKNIKILVDSVDWLSTETNNLFFNLTKWVHYNYRIRYLNNKTNGIIAISSYLSEYYKKSGNKTIIIPPLSTVKRRKVNENFNDVLTISYAGIPFRKGKKLKNKSIMKDRIDIAIELMSAAKKRGIHFLFEIYGFTKEEYLIVVPEQKSLIEFLGENIRFNGLTTNDIVTKNIAISDFTILIRDVKRDTLAGFPTKVSESISYGTPVITTKTSDLEQYIKEGETGFFLDTSDKDKMIETFINILNINRVKRLYMKTICIESNLFSYEKYVNKFKIFLDEIE